MKFATVLSSLALMAGFAAATFNLNDVELALARRHENSNSVITVTSISTVTVCDSGNPILNPPPQTASTGVSIGSSEMSVAPPVSSGLPAPPPSEAVPPIVTTLSIPATGTNPYGPPSSGITSAPGTPTTSPLHTEKPAKPSSSAAPPPPTESNAATHAGMNAGAGALVLGGMAFFMAAV
ncbi:uncharacterized protein EI97DRAFT_456935 [Westerdykella ornata]|uniref:Uncharacterized protein n=1 Tax=Westerdykella ornata TaxID=318751 RepID=A0A6A6JU40_WESOR|nr:uncharacterized protein EI97DRAFT_456935 [Westerdykella ornata]KAF2278549.1 hypothetical protein EI97DRAFT_456935 [Westerdykella ornata]